MSIDSYKHMNIGWASAGVSKRLIWLTIGHIRGVMSHKNKCPPATDVLLDVTVPFSGGGTPAYLEIDKLADGRYRTTVGTMFEFQELCRTGDLEGLLRHVRLVQVSRSFNDMVSAIRAMYVLDDSGNKS